VINAEGKVIGQQNAVGNPAEALLKSNVFVHGSVIFRKAAIDEVGPYNELFNFSEDYELWLRISSCFDVGFLNSPLYAWRYHQNSRFALSLTLFQG